MPRLTNPETGFVLSLLAALALGLTGYTYWQTGRVEPLMAVPAVGLLGMLAAMPFLSGWRPGAQAVTGRGLQTCGACRTLWSPAEDGLAFCPGCGVVPKSAPAYLQRHPYAAPTMMRQR